MIKRLHLVWLLEQGAELWISHYNPQLSVSQMNGHSFADAASCASGGSSVAVLLTALVLVRKLGKRNSYTPPTRRRSSGSNSGSSTGNSSSEEVSIFDKQRVVRTCTFVYR